LSNHTRSSPEDQRVDHVDKGDTDRLRRENTELQIIIDDLRETIRMQAAKLEQESNGHPKIQDESSHQNAEQQEVIRNLEESLRNVTDQKVQLEVDQGKLLAEIERLQDAATFVTNRNNLQHTQPVSAMEVEHSRTDDKVAGAGLSQALKEELEDMRVRCTTLEHERDSLKTHIKELQDDLDTLRLSMSALTQGESTKIIL
jgi:chromosome segregation ATPase